MSFKRFFLVRLGWALGALLIAVSVVFLMFHVFSPTRFECSGTGCPPEVQQAIEDYYDHGHVVPVRFARYLRNFFSDGSMGASFITARESRSIALRGIPATGALVLFGLALALALASAVAIPWSRAGGRFRRVWRIPVYLGVGLPPLFLALLLSYYVGYRLGWLPITGYCDFFDPPKERGCGGAVDWTKHLILPWLAFAVFFAAVYVRILRVLLVDTLAAKAEDRARLARRSKLVMARS